MSEADQAGETRQGTGERLLAGRYRLGRVLGRGGMGTVWRAEDETLGRTVAVKELRFPSSDEDEKRRLVTRTLREAKAIARIRNNSAVTVYDVVDEDDRPWIVMELVEGRSLAEVIREDGVLTPKRAAEVGLAVLDVLRSAHGAGILHRDVKPSNVLIAEDGRVVLTDFGIAQVEGDPSITSTGMLVGAPSYISPERARGHRPGPAADLWSLGALLYACVEGVPPYDKGSAIATLTAVMTEPVEHPRNAGPLEPAIYGLLVKDVEQRLDETGARTMLQEVAHAPQPTAPAPASDRATTSLRVSDEARRDGVQGDGSDAPAAGGPATDPAAGAASGPSGTVGIPSGTAGTPSGARTPSESGKPAGAAQERRLRSALRSVRKAAAAASGAAATAVQGRSAARPAESGTATGSGAAASGSTAGSDARAEDAEGSGTAEPRTSEAAGTAPGDTTPPAAKGAPVTSTASDPAQDSDSDAASGSGPAGTDAAAHRSTSGAPDDPPSDPLRKRPRAGGTGDPRVPRAERSTAPDADGPSTERSGSDASGTAPAGDESPSGTAPAGDESPSGTGTESPAATAVFGSVAHGSAAAASSGTGDSKGPGAATDLPGKGLADTTRAAPLGAFGPAGPPRTPPSRPGTATRRTGSGPWNLPHRTLLIVAVVVALAVLGTILALTLPGDDTTPEGKGGGTAATGGGGTSGGKQDNGTGGGQDDGKDTGKDDHGSHGSDDKGSGGGTGDAGKPSGGPTSGTGTGTGEGAAVGTYRDPQGFSLGLPKGWKRTGTDAAGVRFTGPHNQALLLASTNSPKANPVLDWHQQEHYMGLSQYHRIRIDGLEYRGWPAADWEFTFESSGVKRHRIDRGFVTSPKHGYGMMYTANDSEWTSDLSRATWNTFTSTFTPAK
ncbi:serine/threonine-protein kinase [Streptomyces sp. TS71-3]|uniref:serine/threonine-protein kinase n=1 Tax=Streptomyces sp. TS71-3 TaxID=2733862 RepID=UPI001B06340E|nr:serine/threonine-protein kinase [Streptomyces sp. TS71-3]GHJ35018.1 hypothetical protein Sm713_06270 [Streptomyces sp. TS71-3]